jgi:hypothetical protein
MGLVDRYNILWTSGKKRVDQVLAMKVGKPLTSAAEPGVNELDDDSLLILGVLDVRA